MAKVYFTIFPLPHTGLSPATDRLIPFSAKLKALKKKQITETLKVFSFCGYYVIDQYLFCGCKLEIAVNISNKFS